MPTVEQFLNRLLQAQEAISAAGGDAPAASLVLAESVLHYRRLRQDCEPRPLNLVVVGPTQAGKSTAVNWLLGTQAADVNALAGYTRHAQAFVSEPLPVSTADCLAAFFTGWRQREQNQLTADDLHAYSIRQVSGRSLSAYQPLIVWDTPDFDSVSSRQYRSVALKLLALADVVLFMVSKEKYADQTVWDTLQLIRPLQLPLLLCINKTPAEAAAELSASLRQRLDSAQIAASVMTLPYLDDSRIATAAGQLQDAVRPLLAKAEQQPVQQAVSALLQQYWPAWTAPVREELEQSRLWTTLVEQALQGACQSYQQNYLQAPLYSATLQQAMARLLELLEIPGLAQSLGKARQLLTWPARKVRGLFGSASVSRSAQGMKNQEQALLDSIVQQALVSLQHEAGQQMSQSRGAARRWWSALFSELSTHSEPVQKALHEAVTDYQQDFHDNIDQAAQQLYQHLQEHPARLNSLRAARASADAAAVVLALKTGGIGLNDLVLTPAMLSFTSMLTEGALGQYMQRVEKKLKQAQQTIVCDELLQGELKSRLQQLVENMPKQGLYGISEQALKDIEEQVMADV